MPAILTPAGQYLPLNVGSLVPWAPADDFLHEPWRVAWIGPGAGDGIVHFLEGATGCDIVFADKLQAAAWITETVRAAHDLAARACPGLYILPADSCPEMY